MERMGNWIRFWKTQNVFTPLSFDKCMEIFIEGTESLLRYDKSDEVLDIGCGPGALEARLKNRVTSIDALDVSENYLDFCRARFKGAPNLTFHRLDSSNYTELSAVGSKKFSLITCLSVIQYYRSKDDVEKLIRNTLQAAKPGARIFISDIPCRTSLVYEVFTHLYEGLKRRYFFKMLAMLARARFSDYTQVRKESGILSYSEAELRALADKLGVRAQILTQRLTTNGGRLHLFITV